MQLRPLLLAALGATVLSLPARAGVEEQDVDYLFRFFNDADDVSVFSHYGNYLINLENGVEASVYWNHEVVTIPAVQAPAGSQEAVDAITSASRPISNASDAFRDYRKHRNELQADIGNRRLQLGYYVSSESDYFAQQARANTNIDLFDQNLNLAVGTSHGWDAIEPLADADTQGLDDRKNTWHLNVVATQVLGPTTVLRVGGEINWVNGLQHNPYRNVYAGGGPQPEVHPDRRVRRDAFVKLHQYLMNRSSIKGTYRYYTDDWGVVSHTLGTRLTQYISENINVRYRYRYYRQTEADFFRAEYETADGIDGFRTADYRLQEFRSHLFGAQVNVNLGIVPVARGFFGGLDLSLKYERYFNSNNFSANVFESGLAYRF